MDQNWFDSQAPGAIDEWTFSEQLGEQAQSVLQEHWNSWITDDDIRTISESGFNHIRIPVGYWAFIDQPSGTPYVSMGGQLDQITRVLKSAADYGLYAILDVHGLPGSQNGEEASGHTGSNDFYQDQNQQYGDDTVEAALNYISSSPYKDIITALAVCNEPVYYSEDQFNTLVGFYERSYQKTSAAGVPMMFHPGHPQTPALPLFQDFINGKDPELLIFEIHPYPGRLQPIQPQSQLLQEVCNDATSYLGYGVPVAVTEWCLSSAYWNQTQFISQFWLTQLKAWDEVAGGVFWSYRVNALPATANMTENHTLYSFIDLRNDNVIPLPSQGESSEQYIAGLQGQCSGSISSESYGSTVTSVLPTVTSAFTKRAVMLEAPKATAQA